MTTRNADVEQRQVSALRAAFGPLILASLKDPQVVEVRVNPDSRVWVDRHGQGRSQVGTTSAEESETIIRLMANYVGKVVNTHQPRLSATLPETGERFQAFMPPIVHAPCYTIRKRPDVVFSLDSYVERGILTQAQLEVIRHGAEDRKNFLICGGTGSGKTTLANAILAEPAYQNARVLIIEDTRELQPSSLDHIQTLTKDAPQPVTMTDLLHDALRMSPDRIVVGEVRGGEALDMIKAANTGHPGGVATVHADSARQALTRIEQLVGEVAVNVPHHAIAEAIDIIVDIQRTPTGRSVRSVCTVGGYTASAGYQITPCDA